MSGEGSLEDGTPDEVMEKKRRANAEKLRPARLEAARRNSKWTEIEDDLVRRNQGRRRLHRVDDVLEVGSTIVNRGGHRLDSLDKNPPCPPRCILRLSRESTEGGF